MMFIKKAMQFAPLNGVYKMEYGYVAYLASNTKMLIFIEKFDDSKNAFTEASEVDASNLKALYGIILAELSKREFEKAAEEMEIFNELHDTMGIFYD